MPKINNTLTPSFISKVFDKGIVPIIRISAFEHFHPVGSLLKTLNGSTEYLVRTLQISGETSETFGQTQTETPYSDGGWIEESFKIEDIRTAIKMENSIIRSYQASLENGYTDIVLSPLYAKWHAVNTNISMKAGQVLYQGNPRLGVSGFLTSPRTKVLDAIDWINATPLDIYSSILTGVMSITSNTSFMPMNPYGVKIIIPTTLTSVLGEFITFGGTPVTQTLETALLAIAGVEAIVRENPTLMATTGENLKVLIISTNPDHAGVGIDNGALGASPRELSENNLWAKDDFMRTLALPTISKNTVEEFNNALLLRPFNTMGWIPNIKEDAYESSYYLPFAGGIVKQSGMSCSLDTGVTMTPITSYSSSEAFYSVVKKRAEAKLIK